VKCSMGGPPEAKDSGAVICYTLLWEDSPSTNHILQDRPSFTNYDLETDVDASARLSPR